MSFKYLIIHFLLSISLLTNYLINMAPIDNGNSKNDESIIYSDNYYTIKCENNYRNCECIQRIFYIYQGMQLIKFLY